jgi:hypothetical protein
MEKGEKQQGRESLLGRMIAPEFVCGVLHHAALRFGGRFSFATNQIRLHRAFKASFDNLHQIADQQGQSLTFTINPDRMHGISDVVNEELGYLRDYYPGVESYGNSYATLVYDAKNPLAQDLVEHFTGSSELYDQLAAIFLDAYLDEPQT